ncbi:uncharacterized protein O3C94_006306 [Discoglossus pictus]
MQDALPAISHSDEKMGTVDGMQGGVIRSGADGRAHVLRAAVDVCNRWRTNNGEKLKWGIDAGAGCLRVQFILISQYAFFLECIHRYFPIFRDTVFHNHILQRAAETLSGPTADKTLERRTRSKEMNNIYENEFKRDNQGAEKQNLKKLHVIVLVTLLILVFLLLIVLTGLVFLFYHNIIFKVSEIEQSTAEIRQIEILKNSCPCGWIFIQRSCYYFAIQRLNWTESQDFCAEQGSSLLILSDIHEMIAVTQSLTQSSWIGLTMETGEWKWLDGTNLMFTKWSPNEPNNLNGDEKCGEITSIGWNDSPCKWQKSFICKKPVQT